MTENIFSAFRATGFIPLDRFRVLKKIPAYDPVKHPDSDDMHPLPAPPRPSTPIKSPAQIIPLTPKTPKSLNQLGQQILEKEISNSPSHRYQRQRIVKLLHAAQFALAKNHLTEQARWEEREEERQRKEKKQKERLGYKKIGEAGQAFATGAELQQWKRDLLRSERKKTCI